VYLLEKGRWPGEGRRVEPMGLDTGRLSHLPATCSCLTPSSPFPPPGRVGGGGFPAVPSAQALQPQHTHLGIRTAHCCVSGHTHIAEKWSCRGHSCHIVPPQVAAIFFRSGGG
jgi:hypothetical protein